MKEHYPIWKRVKYIIKNGKMPELTEEKLTYYDLIIFHKKPNNQTKFYNESSRSDFDQMLDWFYSDKSPYYNFGFNRGTECFARNDISSIKILGKPYTIKILKEEKE